MPRLHTPDAPTVPVCARCAKRIGIYELLWWQRPDGPILASGFIAASQDPRHADGGSQFFHLGCLTAVEAAAANV